MDKYKDKISKGTIITIVLLLSLVLTFGTLLYFTFRTVGDEKEQIAREAIDFESLQITASAVTSVKFAELRGATAEIKEQVVKETALASDYTIGSMGEAKIRSGASAEEKLVNEFIYSAAQEAFGKVTLSKWPSEYRDPMILMAQSSTESLPLANGKIAYSPLTVTAGIPLNELTVDKMSSYNFAEAIKNTTIKTSITGNPTYQGPSQFNRTYGADDKSAKYYNRADLKYTDEVSSVSADSQALSRQKSGYGNVILRKTTNGLKIGDRFNIHDISIQQIAKYEFTMQYRKNTALDKDIDNIYSFAAYIGLVHNVGEGVSTQGPEASRPTFFSGAKNKDLSQWINFLGTAPVVAEFDLIAQEIVDSFRNGNGQSMRHLTADELKSIVRKHGGSLPFQSKLLSGIGNGGKYNEVPMHSAKLLVHYLTIQKHYSGD